MSETYKYRLVIKKATYEQWIISAYIPIEGEPVFDTTNKVLKIGNGEDLFLNLPAFYMGDISNFAASELEKITGNNGSGWRLKGMEPSNYGPIGTQALDFSISSDATNTNGATGVYSAALGYNTIAKNQNQLVFGKYNIGVSAGTIAEIGVGTDEYNRKNAFEVYYDGRIIAPELTIENHVNARSLVTKEYVTSKFDNLSIRAGSYTYSSINNAYIPDIDNTENFYLNINQTISAINNPTVLTAGLQGSFIINTDETAPQSFIFEDKYKFVQGQPDLRFPNKAFQIDYKVLDTDTILCNFVAEWSLVDAPLESLTVTENPFEEAYEAEGVEGIFSYNKSIGDANSTYTLEETFNRATTTIMTVPYANLDSFTYRTEEGANAMDRNTKSYRIKIEEQSGIVSYSNSVDAVLYYDSVQ